MTMSFKEWEEMAEAITVGGPLPIRFSAQLYDSDRVMITGLLETIDISKPAEKGEKTHVQTNEIFSLENPPSETFFLTLALKLYDHECREWIKCGNDRFAKPH
jgi:hypothetical protein